MASSMEDKLFFLDKIDANIFVDYGCADGEMLRQLQKHNPQYTLFGYDQNEDMLAIAYSASPHGIEYNDMFLDIMSNLSNIEGKSAIILSSVIHEIYSYKTSFDVSVFWKRVFESGFDYVIIRDMCFDKKLLFMTVDDSIIDMMRHKIDSQYIDDFNHRLGGGSWSMWSLYHFLLKYRYTDNWKREVRENYVPLTSEDYLKLKPDDYSLSFYDHYTLPYIKETVRNDLGLDVTEATHIKIIFKRKF